MADNPQKNRAKYRLPKGFNRIRHYGLLASGRRRANLEHARQLLEFSPPQANDAPIEPPDNRPPCSCCGGHTVVIEAIERRYQPRAPPFVTTSSGSNAL